MHDNILVFIFLLFVESSEPSVADICYFQKGVKQIVQTNSKFNFNLHVVFCPICKETRIQI